MSSFVTKIPVNIEAVKKLLPEGSHVEAVIPESKDGAHSLLLQWSNHRLQTPFTFHQEFPMGMLEEHKLPADTKFLEDDPTKHKPAPEKPPAPRRGRHQKKAVDNGVITYDTPE